MKNDLFAEKNKLIDIKNFANNHLDTETNFFQVGDIVPGDKLVTSGLGKKYPKGIDVGIVNKISVTSNNEFLEIEVLGTSEFNSGDQILLTSP